MKQEHSLQLLYEDSEKTESAFEGAMQRLLDGGATIIVANGFYFKELVEKHAKIHPDRYFILQDAELPDLPNVVSILYSVHEGSFLAGALAGMITSSGNVGFIGGVDIPIMHEFRIGFQEGVLFTNPDATMEEEFISKAPDFSGFRKPAVGFERAAAMYADDVDIIYVAAGLSGNGVLQAAKNSGKFAIGVDSDQDYLAAGFIFTSMMKRLDNATYMEVSKIIDGKFSPGIKKYGLKEDGVGLSEMKFTRHLIPRPVLHRLDQIRADIINGEIRIGSNLEGNNSQKQEKAGE